MRYVLSRTIVEDIRRIILAWPHPTMTWADICAVVNTAFKADWTRQALSNHDRIQKAYDATKKRLRGRTIEHILTTLDEDLTTLLSGVAA